MNTITLGFDSAKGSTNWLNYDSLIVKEPSEKQSVEWDLKEEAELAQQSLEDNFWDNETSMFRNQYPDDEENNRFHYWWLAHGIDTLMDGYERTGNSQYIDKATALYAAVKERNGGEISATIFMMTCFGWLLLYNASINSRMILNMNKLFLHCGRI
ncbi:hypothetical protein [Gracilibacillus sp. JCM 18860]|uniref:hypothetical protein n=1 Tax=Gracilibacillus sp. JCM 18860 TaxID=1306159 RepID=UPI0006CFB947